MSGKGAGHAATNAASSGKPNATVTGVNPPSGSVGVPVYNGSNAGVGVGVSGQAGKGGGVGVGVGFSYKW